MAKYGFKLAFAIKINTSQPVTVVFMKASGEVIVVFSTQDMGMAINFAARFPKVLN